MIVVTGALGFIGSALLGELIRRGYGDLVAVDDFSAIEKQPNLSGKSIRWQVPREQFLTWMEHHGKQVQALFHIGARTNTAETSWEVLSRLNVHYTETLFEQCTRFSIPFIYASSAATYGDGSAGFQDGFHHIQNLVPLNPYGSSKQQVDLWVKEQSEKSPYHTSVPPFWAGFKFFNVFGPNEYHKGRMASVVFHAYNQIHQNGNVKLFKSYREGIPHGWQKRDFIWIKDVLNVLIYFMEHRKNSGLYNLGTGEARTFLDLANAVFHSCNLEPKIEFVEMPEDIRENYQYFTQAEMQRLREAGYQEQFTSLELAVEDYIANYLKPMRYL